MHRTTWVPLLLVLAAIPVVAYAAGGPDLLHMPIGDPARKVRDVPIVLDAVVDTHTGDPLTPDDLAERLADVKLLLIGENHTAMDAHRVEARVIDLLARHGRRVLVGIEMFPYTEQRWLDAWNENLVTEPGFLHLSHWYRYWGFPWQYYRDVFLTAREDDAPMIALNAPREIVDAVRKKGFQNLTPDEAAHIPSNIDVDSAEQLQLFKASFMEGDSIHGGASDAAWKRMLAAQATWDATMAFNAAKALEKLGDDKTIMVVLAGAGHVEYGLGIERQAQHFFKGKMATLVSVAVRHTGGGTQSVRASYADYVWGIPSEMYPAFPDLGVAMGGGASPEVLQVDPESAAANAGVQAGDALVSIDGFALSDDDEMFNAIMATKRWGDTAALVVRRGDKQITLRAEFRRVMPTMLAHR